MLPKNDKCQSRRSHFTFQLSFAPDAHHAPEPQHSQVRLSLTPSGSPHPPVRRSASLVITLLGGLVHSFLALQLASSWRTLRALEAENEFEMGKFDGLRVLWALLALYLLAAAFVSFVGFLGVLRVRRFLFRWAWHGEVLESERVAGGLASDAS